ncbi:hypothetical protein CEN39_15125 [Fischerella thermalis CCMEE 5201]|jgi:hypothetical protein|nr:hypothetical protein CEN39_15125 [Fischerella thermalis CCMEE 5201]
MISSPANCLLDKAWALGIGHWALENYQYLNYRLPITHYQLPITNYPLPITDLNEHTSVQAK